MKYMDISRLVKDVRLAADEIKYNASTAYNAIRGNPTARRAAYTTFFLAPVIVSCGNYDDGDGPNITHPQCNDGWDNDNDNRTDYGIGNTNDPECASRDDNDERYPGNQF